MKTRNFYLLSSRLSSATVQAHAIGLSQASGKEISDEFRLIMGDYSGISFPVKFEQAYGKKLEDVLDTGWPYLYLISERMRDALHLNHLSGWKTFDVRVFDKKKAAISGYYGFSVIGRCGPIDVDKSQIFEKRPTPQGPAFRYYRGMHIGIEKWDGSDFFMPEKYYGIVVTEKAVEILKKNRISNIKPLNLEEIEMPEMTAKVIREKTRNT